MNLQKFKKIYISFLFVIFSFIISLFFCSCNITRTDTVSGQSEKTMFTDSCNREIEVDKNIDKVIVTGPVSQQILLTFAPDKLCGLATNDKHKTYIDDNFSQLPIFGQIYGGKQDFDKESIIASGSQAIIDIGEGKKTISQDMNDLQNQLNIPCIHIESSLGTYDYVYFMLGKLLNMTEKGEMLGKYCRIKYDDTVKALDSISKKRGIYVIGKSATNVIAKGSFHADVIDLCTENIAVSDIVPEKGTGTETDTEQINLWNPDVVVFGADTKDVYNSVKYKNEWSEISAIRNNMYYMTPDVPFNWMSSPAGSNQILGLQWLSWKLYPELFTGNIEDMVMEYYKLFYNKDLSREEYNKIISQ